MSGGGTRRGTLRGVDAATDESGRRAAGLTAGAAAAWCRCVQESGGGTRRGTLRGVAAAADESGRRAAGLTAGAAAAWCRCVQESEGGTRRGTLRGFAAAADESGRRAAGLTAGAAAAGVGACWRVTGGSSPRHPERGWRGLRRRGRPRGPSRPVRRMARGRWRGSTTVIRAIKGLVMCGGVVGRLHRTSSGELLCGAVTERQVSLI
jgi:hypothetical protein